MPARSDNTADTATVDTSSLQPLIKRFTVGLYNTGALGATGTAAYYKFNLTDEFVNNDSVGSADFINDQWTLTPGLWTIKSVTNGYSVNNYSVSLYDVTAATYVMGSQQYLATGSTPHVYQQHMNYDAYHTVDNTYELHYRLDTAASLAAALGSVSGTHQGGNSWIYIECVRWRDAP